MPAKGDFIRVLTYKVGPDGTGDFAGLKLGGDFRRVGILGFADFLRGLSGSILLQYLRRNDDAAFAELGAD